MRTLSFISFNHLFKVEFNFQVRSQLFPPKKPPRSFRATQSFDTDPVQRTLSISTNESFTNIKNISLDSIDELSSIRNFSSTTDSCFNSHYNQGKDQANLLTSTSSLHLSDVTSLSMPSKATAFSYNQSSYHTSMLSRSKSVSPQSPSIYDRHSPQILPQQSDFATDEFYIDESLPSSVGTANSQGSEFVRQLDTANIVVAMLQVSIYRFIKVFFQSVAFLLLHSCWFFESRCFICFFQLVKVFLICNNFYYYFLYFYISVLFFLSS